MRGHLLALILSAISGLSARCDLEGLVFHLSDTTLRAGAENEISLVYSEGNLFMQPGNICGFQVRWLYDTASLSFPDCEGADATHVCRTPPLPDGHPGLFCLCNASSVGGGGRIGQMEVIAIPVDGVTPLPAGPTVVGRFRVRAAPDAVPDLYSLVFERPSRGDPSIGAVLCEDARMTIDQLKFVDALVIVPQ